MDIGLARGEISDEQLAALKRRYDNSVDRSGYKYDVEGRLVIEFKDPEKYEELVEKQTTEIEDLEAKLQRIKFEKEQNERKARKKREQEKKKDEKKSKKQKRREKNDMILSVFNEAPLVTANEEGEEGEEGLGKYKPLKERRKAAKKKKADPTELVAEEKYSQRFAPILATVIDVSDRLDVVSDMVEEDLAKPGGSRMYKAQQYSNLIQLAKGKLDCSKELHNIAKTMSNLELKQDSKKEDENTNVSTIMNSVGLSILRGAYDDDEVVKSNKNSKKSNKDKRKKGEDKDWEEKRDSEFKLAKQLAKRANNGDFDLTSHEKHIKWEGKYIQAVQVEEGNDSNWKFVALDPKTGKKIKDFPKDLLYRKKDYPKLKIQWDRGKAKCPTMGQTFKLLVK